jgi:hypothetical protein
MMPFAFRPIIAAAAVVLAGCGSAPAPSSPAISAVPHSTADGAYPAAFAASAAGGGGSVQGLAVFSSSDGRLLRWLVRSTSLPVPVAVSLGGAWVYYYYPAAPRPPCPSNGFVEPLLWRVHVNGGRPPRADIRTTDLAFSPDGRMVAYTSTQRCGQTLLIVVRDQRTGVTRRIIAARNSLSGNGPVFYAQLSWAPDDVHLAVAVAPAAAINTLEVIDARRATDITRAQPIPPCAAQHVGCLDPSFDVHGRLTFLNWLEEPSRSAEWVVRWQNGHAIRLFRLSQAVSFNAAIAVDQTGNAILLEGYLRQPELWRWSGGSLALLRRSTRRLVVTSPLWLVR